MTQDAIAIAPNAYKVVLENDRVRVLEARMSPGERTEMHSHPPVVAVALQGGKYRFTQGDGQTMEVDVPVGVPMYFEAVDHETENIGDTEGVTLLIELK